jgi:hypothetical protein
LYAPCNTRYRACSTPRGCSTCLSYSSTNAVSKGTTPCRARNLRSAADARNRDASADANLLGRATICLAGEQARLVGRRRHLGGAQGKSAEQGASCNLGTEHDDLTKGMNDEREAEGTKARQATTVWTSAKGEKAFFILFPLALSSTTSPRSIAVPSHTACIVSQSQPGTFGLLATQASIFEQGVRSPCQIKDRGLINYK